MRVSSVADALDGGADDSCTRRMGERYPVFEGLLLALGVTTLILLVVTAFRRNGITDNAPFD